MKTTKKTTKELFNFTFQQFMEYEKIDNKVQKHVAKDLIRDIFRFIGVTDNVELYCFYEETKNYKKPFEIEAHIISEYTKLVDKKYWNMHDNKPFSTEEYKLSVLIPFLRFIGVNFTLLNIRAAKQSLNYF